MGDFNTHCDKINTSKTIKDSANHINSVCCVQLINKPTRICATCSSTIDHIYINATCASNVSSVILQEDTSDHLPLCVKYRCFPTIKTSQRPYTRSIKQESIESFLSDLNDALFSPEMFNCNNLDKLCNLIGDLTNQYFPAKIQS